ncbi:alpha/beta hydrolase [Jiella mangrovi]|uniref:Alpha/beta hydrolase n=1 Tax=Jiella mangrovi TaxID=2821407 RepID=A0ABS4BK72_9HYPH|nr:alpha/beta hydrolase [Jiella mangrovi]MBP0617158.1 alpha/beta hydrolase [Jiella mangrovi]
MLSQEAKAVLADLARKKAAQAEPRDAREKLAQARAMTASLSDYSGTAPRGVSSEDISVERPAGCADDGAGPIRVRLYRPSGPASAMLVWYHGGGAMAGSLDSHDIALRQLCEATGRLVASVDYRLAPEHISPAPQTDCIAATMALMARAGDFGCHPATVAIGGDSIGGLFAAVVVRALLEAGAAVPAKLVMLYPNTDLRPDRPFLSLKTEAGNVMTEESLAYENALFVPDPRERSDPRVSPLLARDFHGFPDTLVVTCEHDPLRDEGELFCSKLHASGVTARHLRVEGMIHGFLQMDGWIGATSQLRAATAHHLT